MIVAYAGQDMILPVRLAKTLPGRAFRCIWHSMVKGKMLYVHVPDIRSLSNFCVSDCEWEKVDDLGWYKGTI